MMKKEIVIDSSDDSSMSTSLIFVQPFWMIKMVAYRSRLSPNATLHKSIVKFGRADTIGRRMSID